MTNAEQKIAAKKFAENWNGRGYEKGECQIFWIELLTTVYGVTDISSFITFEEQVKLDHTSFIDGYIDSTHVMIEQKSIDKSLTAPIKQSDGTSCTPFQQAKRYSAELPYSKRPRWIVTSNFKSFYVYDMEKPSEEPEIIQLANLEKEYYRLQFLVDQGNEHLQKEMEVSIKAGELVGLIYDALYKQYKNPNELSLKSLNALCVRLVFCLYAEDADIFGRRGMFRDYMSQFSAKDWRKRLIELFQVFDTMEEDRDKYIEEDLGAFPYVNGGLFADESIEIPNFTEEIVELILHKASESFDWSEISPTIFGAVFESTLNPETRRSGGMHYTSIENIHKVIDPLFLDKLHEEFEEICSYTVERTKKAKLQAFQHKLASLKFLDPACGSGNFLTETYISLRKLENKVITELSKGQIFLGEFLNPIMVSIDQFYGIEINDFAVTVAKTALWIAESQMMKETEYIVHMQLDFLPLTTNAYITEGNALTTDWNDIVSKYELNYIMGNPPFIGARKMKQDSVPKKEVQDIFGAIKDVQDLDYVTCWYKLAAKYIQNTRIEVCFVSTNSVCQGAQVPILWNVLFNECKVHINFAYQTFKWSSESTNQAAVHCVIIGFSVFNRPKKVLYMSDKSVYKIVSSISPYLVEGKEEYVEASKVALCDVPKMIFGNQPRDGGYFILTEEERDKIIGKEPALEKWIRVYMGADEFIKGKKRYCFWLSECPPHEIQHSRTLSERVDAVRKFRLESSAKTTRGYAKVPQCFAQMTQPMNESYIIIPSVSSERRLYIPMGFLDENTISSNAVQIIPKANIYHFGILTSNVHMSWMRTVAGRLKSDYRYSQEIVYNTFPWPTPTEAQIEKIKGTAQAILDARALYPESSLSDMYGEKMYLYPKLLAAHQQNNKAVMEAYGFWGKLNSESECVTELMKMYQNMTK